MVSLDGNDITNADILAEGNLTGTLNLQFSSSATLVPMENSDLKTMESYDVTVNGTKVGAAGSLSNLIGEYKPGDTVQLTVIRDGKEIAVNVKLEGYKDK